MENIHLLSTEKPSRLFNCFEKLEIGDYTTIRENLQVTNQHIYITSDEEIKEGELKKGDWYYSPIHNKVFQCIHNNQGFELERKIILTTDQDLIKDGVQAISDEFLEWYVNNPSCEEVKVEEIDSKLPKKEVDGYFSNETLLGYKIIIPKQEPKQEFCDNCGNEICCCILRKQETLDEVAERLHPEEWDWREREIFISGAKWQQEIMFKIMDTYAEDVMGGSILRAKEWFEQFKKK